MIEAVVPTVPRSRWQVHLSTAIILVISAGIAIGLNLRSHSDVESFSFSGKSPLNAETQKNLQNVCWYGWPFPIVVTQRTAVESNIDVVFVRVGAFHYAWGWNYLALFTDAIISLGILASLAYVCETVIRWRATL